MKESNECRFDLKECKNTNNTKKNQKKHYLAPCSYWKWDKSMLGVWILRTTMVFATITFALDLIFTGYWQIALTFLILSLFTGYFITIKARAKLSKKDKALLDHVNLISKNKFRSLINWVGLSYLFFYSCFKLYTFIILYQSIT